jgi:hypothetical protein
MVTALHAPSTCRSGVSQTVLSTFIDGRRVPLKDKEKITVIQVNQNEWNIVIKEPMRVDQNRSIYPSMLALLCRLQTTTFVAV